MSCGIRWPDRDWFVMNSMNPTIRTWFSWHFSRFGNIRGTTCLKYNEPWYEQSRLINFPTVFMAWFHLILGIESHKRLGRFWLILCVYYSKTLTGTNKRARVCFKSNENLLLQADVYRWNKLRFMLNANLRGNVRSLVNATPNVF